MLQESDRNADISHFVDTVLAKAVNTILPLDDCCSNAVLEKQDMHLVLDDKCSPFTLFQPVMMFNERREKQQAQLH